LHTGSERTDGNNQNGNGEIACIIVRRSGHIASCCAVRRCYKVL
jgi:hypothetical protein